MAAKLLNVAHDEVRQHRIAIVEGIVERYDIDGFELEFQRHGLYLPKAQVEAGTPLITDMIRRIRTIFDRFENERGHPICLMVRVPSWLELCQRMGFDLKTWIEEGTVDMIAASSVAQTELDAPLEDFVALAQGTPCEIFGTLEYISQPPYEKYLPGMGRAGAAWYHHCGVDGIYFENDHHHYEPYLDANTGEPRVVQPVEHRSLYNELHDPQALRWRSKRYVVSAEHMPWPSLPKPLPTTWERSQEGETKRVTVKIADDMQPALQKFACWSWFSFLMAWLCFLTVVLGQTNGVSTETSLANPSWQVLDQRPGQGEQCLVCDRGIYGHDVVTLRYKGRKFYVQAGQMFAKFENEPDRFFQKVQARSVLFDETGVAVGPMAIGWLWVGVYILAGLIFGAVCSYVAVARAVAPCPWFVAGFVGNIVALIVLCLVAKGDRAILPAGVPSGLSKVPTTRAPIRCSECRCENHPGAAECSHCGASLDPTVEPETHRL